MAQFQKNNRGAILIEAISSIALFIIVFIFCGCVFILSLSRMTITHLNYLAIVEALEKKSDRNISDVYKNRIENVFSFIDVLSWQIKLDRTANQQYESKGTVVWNINILGLKSEGRDRQELSEKRMRALR